jgi:hypothetical protein
MFQPVYFAEVITENEIKSSPIAHFLLFALEVSNGQTKKMRCVLGLV